jgi:hypothetical protein
VGAALGWIFHPLLLDRGPSDRDLVYHYSPIAQLRAATFERMTLVLGVDYVVTVPDDPCMAGRKPIMRSGEPAIVAYRLRRVRRDVHLATRVTP